MKQTDIAQAMSLSQARVSRLLQKASDVGIVRTVVTVPAGLHPELEEALEERYGLSEAVVAHGDGDPHSLSALGGAAARYLETAIRDSDRVGISSWSETLLAAVSVMRPQPSLAARSVVQMVGGRGTPQVQMRANLMLERLASLLGAQPVIMMTPAVMGSARAKDELMADSSMQPIVDAWGSLTVALVGIGALEQSPMLAASGNVQDDADRAQLTAAGAVGDVCLHYVTAEGRLVQSDFEKRVMTIDEQTFKSIPRRVGVAGGVHKLAAVRASLEGGWINALITDHDLARELVSARR